MLLLRRTDTTFNILSSHLAPRFRLVYLLDISVKNDHLKSSVMRHIRKLTYQDILWWKKILLDENANTVLTEITITLIITTLGDISHFPLFFISKKWIQCYLQKQANSSIWLRLGPFIRISNMLVSWIVQNYSALVRALASYQSSPSPGINEFLIGSVTG